jgi:hypothetical protein
LNDVLYTLVWIFGGGALAGLIVGVSCWFYPLKHGGKVFFYCILGYLVISLVYCFLYIPVNLVQDYRSLSTGFDRYRYGYR